MGRQMFEEQLEDLMGLVRRLDEEMRELWVELFKKRSEKVFLAGEIAMKRECLS